MPINKRVDKKTLIYPCHGILLTIKKNTKILIYMNNIANSQTTELKKTATKEYIPYDFIYMMFYNRQNSFMMK